MKPRTLASAIQRAAKTFPAIVVTGPRQSGKTTLLKALYAKTHKFVTLEDPDTRLRASVDPRSFLDTNRPPVIIDEIQYAPELLSYIKTSIDERRKPGQWLFTGSQNFALMQGVSESLAGRAAIFSLLPFSYSERLGIGEKSLSPSKFLKISITHGNAQKKTTRISLADTILRGNYPEIASRKSVDRKLWSGSYIATYLERDVRALANIGDLNQFERFLRLAATRTGTILNLSDMARDIGISVTTAKRWLSALEASYQVYLLYPYYRNIGKRIVKSPKMYFNDTGLASYLLGLHTKETLINSPHFGALFETLIITDFWKRFLHHGESPTLYYLRTRDGLEVDLVLEINTRLHLFEIKSTATVMPRHGASLIRAKRSFPTTANASVISQGKTQFISQGISYWHWDVLLSQ